MDKTIPSYNSYSEETQLILMNIDDLLIEHPVPVTMIKEINDYIHTHKISITALADKINSNITVADYPGYDSALVNQWIACEGNYSNIYIKLSISVNYLTSLIDGNISSIHSVIAEAILTSMYSFEIKDLTEARTLAHSKLALYHILRCRGGNFIQVSDSNFNELFGDVEPGVAETLTQITSGLKLISTLTKKDGYGLTKLKQIQNNLKNDIGFYFAYMSLDITDLEQKSKNKKQDFLDELKALIRKYSSDSDGIDLYH